MHWQFWQPKHTLESVGQRIVDGLDGGSIELGPPLDDEPFDEELCVRLDIPPGASEAEIARAVRRLVMAIDAAQREFGGKGLATSRLDIFAMTDPALAPHVRAALAALPDAASNAKPTAEP